MPTFELVSIVEATLKTATGKRAQIAKEYVGYIEQLREGHAGRLQASEGETGGPSGEDWASRQRWQARISQSGELAMRSISGRSPQSEAAPGGDKGLAKSRAVNRRV